MKAHFNFKFSFYLSWNISKSLRRGIIVIKYSTSAKVNGCFAHGNLFGCKEHEYLRYQFVMSFKVMFGISHCEHFFLLLHFPLINWQLRDWMFSLNI